MATAVAARLRSRLDREGFPSFQDWQRAGPFAFDADWQGSAPDAHLETQVQLLWSSEALFVRFRARYQTITVFENSEVNGRRDLLWERDVAEMFVQPNPEAPRRYKEFEVSPNGLWIDLDIDLDTQERKRDMNSGLRCRARILPKERIWTAEMAIPMLALTLVFNPAKRWRANFFRVEGAQEPRFYSAWNPTHTPQPDFHVPEAFGELTFKG